MGIPLFPFALTLLAAVTAAPDPQVMREERFQNVLAEMDLAAAEQACLNPRIANSDGRRQALRVSMVRLVRHLINELLLYSLACCYMYIHSYKRT